MRHGTNTANNLWGFFSLDITTNEASFIFYCSNFNFQVSCHFAMSPKQSIAKNVQVVTSLLTSWDNLLQQADIRMRSHGLRQLVDDKTVARCRNTRGDKSLQHVAATNRFVRTVKRQVMRAHCSDRLQRQIAWCERFDIRWPVNKIFVAATEFCRCNMAVRHVAATKFCRSEKISVKFSCSHDEICCCVHVLVQTY